MCFNWSIECIRTAVYVFCDVLYMYVGLCVSECYNERVGMGEREKERQTERERERMLRV